MNRSKEPRALINKYLKGTCSPEEELLLEKFYSEESAKRTLLDNEFNLEDKKAEIWDLTQQHINNAAREKGHSFRWLIAAAASIALVIGVSLLFYKAEGEKAKVKVVERKHETIEPAFQRATLTLADGRNITLDDAANGTISNQAGKMVVKLRNGTIIYKDNELSSLHDDHVAINKMSTPRGGYYHLVLSDGSGVWLNSASSISYPASFSAGERVVTVTGEAYFEVVKKKNSMFLVKSGDQVIEVLGTHFNVMAYQDEKLMVTTLLEGSVKIIKNNVMVMLKPGQAATTSVNSGAFTLAEVNLDDAISWKQGYFKFNNENLQSMLNKVSRWYDVDVEFKDNLEETYYWGTYSRSKKLVDLLKDLEQTGDVHFKVTGRRIIVMN
ncbi:putative anti-sigma factor [Arcticibacter svalbardensis MN12-7]|uniref:Putative anti-sigma factor n=1 Tax=Arcticibacter svalbardensis MN12-7 TaxID=1150600 RepID=R9GUX9_9SPHI|nr:FecR family protein [Arcticibacter svalbardensis]EOR95498.1 putative anti-sigma factor [Arcticibacter svalbardensis MN12-7]